MRRILHSVFLFVFITIHGFAQDAAFNWVSPIIGNGSSIIQSTGLAVDLGGATISTGYLLGNADFDPGVGTATLTATSLYDGYIQKLNAFGGYVWAKRIGGTGQTRGQGVDVGTGNNVYSIGYFQGTVDLDPDAGTANRISNGSNDIYVVKLNSSGGFIWGLGIGGTGADLGRAIAVDENNNVYVAGSFQSTVDFDPGAGTTNLVSGGNADVFIAKYSSAGTFVWAKRVGSTGNDFGLSVDVKDGALLVAGTFQNTVDFDPGAGTSNLTAAGGSDAFVLKLDTSGTFVWVKSVGGTTDDFGNSVVINELGDVYFGGDFQGTADLNPSATTFNVASQGSRDVFILKLNSAGTFQWVKTAGGTDEDRAINIAVDTSEYVYIGGHYSNTVDFDPSAGTFNLNSVGATDTYIWKLSSAGDLIYAKQMGSSGSEGGYDIAVDESGFVYSTGIFQNTVDFDPGFATVTKTANLIDVYVHKMGPCNLGLDTLTVFACDSVISPTGAHTWYSSGTYYDTLLAASGCDSIITVYLTVGYVNSSIINVTECDSYDSPSGNYTWTSSGTYMDTVTNVSGCDSMITINLTILNSTASSISPVVCDSFISPSGLYTYTSSGTYSDTLTNAAGCDSVITINLTVNETSYQSFTMTVCDSMASPSGNYTWTTSGSYMDTIPNVSGCDSVMTFNLTVNYTSFATISPTVCDNLTSPSGNYTWTSTGTYMDTISNASGCDSVITVNLTVNYSSTASISPSVCDSFVSPSGNYTWTTSGVYMDTLVNASGCDSVITVNLSVTQTTFQSFILIVCDSMVSPSGNYTWTSTGVYHDTIPNAGGCDSVMTFNLNVKQSTFGTINPVACESYDSPSSNYTWTTTGTYMDTIVNSQGCDSIMTINLTIIHNSFGSISPTVCDSYVSPSGNYTWTSSNTYMDTIPNAVGCDSIITVNLTVNPTTFYSTTMTACNSYTSPSGNYTWTTSGVYNDTIPNANNCDSVMTFNLTINYSTSSTQTITACNSYTSPSGNDVWTVSGIYMDTITNLAGCDSFMTIDLTIHNSNSGVLTTTACDSMISPSGNYVWTESGTYIDTLVNSFGCDSFLLVTLTVNSTKYMNQAVSACDSYELPGGSVVTTGGVYVDTLATAGGCDSIITTDLTINNSSVTNVSETACNSYLWAVNGQTYTESGQYQAVLLSGAGCDSTVNLDLTINTVITSAVTKVTSGDKKGLWVGDMMGVINSYQWLDCDLDFAPISEETDEFFYPTKQIGNYAVEVTHNGCVDTSDCFEVELVGIAEYSENMVRIYPNPTNGRVNIELPNVSDNVKVDVMAADGRLVRSESHTSGASFIETMIDGPAGLYFISVKVGGEPNRVVRIVKE